jgi:2-oxoglutarate dehydrogenase E2 component (dihydrolipoamide succinyltransferase)
VCEVTEAEVPTVEIRAPAEQTEGTRSQVLRWLKSIGEPVSLNEPLIELETDKVTVEVASPGAGVLREILKHENDDVEPGELLGRIGDAEAASPADSLRGAPGAVAGGAGVGAVAGGIRDAGVGSAARVSAARGSATAAAQADASAASSARLDSPARPAAHLLSPAVRRLLSEHSLDASSIRGSGEGGRITVQDVLHAASRAGATSSDAQATAGAAGSAPAAAVAPAPPATVAPASGATVVPPSAEHVRRVPHSAVRKRIAEHMVCSLLQTAPHVTTVFEADLSAVLQHRAAHRDTYASEGVPLTLTAYFLQACVKAIQAVPEVNSRWTDTELQIFDSIHIGVATAVESELVVPVLRDVASLDLKETARALHDLTTRARAHRLTPADVRGGTFTISNHGVSGSLLATPIVINQPQSAILGIGKLEKRVVVEEAESFVVRPRCYVTLTIDHRVLDGHRANQFLQTFVADLTRWSQ